MNGSDPLPVAVRAHALPETPKSTRPRRRKARPEPRLDPARRPRFLLVFDCETRVDAGQGLTFGCYRFYRLRWRKSGPVLSCLEEGVFYADDLAERDPAGFRCLKRYVATKLAETVREPVGGVEPRPDLRLRSRAEFVEHVLRNALKAEATVVTFNALFDLTRLSVKWGAARRKGFEGGFSLTVSEWQDEQGIRRENSFRERLLVKPIDSRRARIGRSHGRRGTDTDTDEATGGGFLDCRTLAYALSGEGQSLESACRAFGVSYRKRKVTHGRITSRYVDYCREDVDATADLYQALASEYERWGLALPPTRAYSPASLAKAMLREADVQPVLRRQPDFPEEVLGYAMVAYYGGRAECRIRKVPVPVCYLDFASMFPTVCTLIGLWELLSCRRVGVVEEDPAKVEAWLSALTVDDCFDPELSPKLNGLALIQPAGEMLPVRARYAAGGTYGIGVNPLTSDEPLWYTLPDLVAARLNGQTPRLLRVLRFKPVGKTRGLRTLRVRGSRPIDPGREDVFKALVEERRRLGVGTGRKTPPTAVALKPTTNSASYGIHAELNRQEPKADPVAVTVHGLDRFTSEVSTVEEPGEFYFPPLASLATGGARLMLALLERLVLDAGGVWAFCDTDSGAIVASDHSRLIPCPGGPTRDGHGRECVRALGSDEVDQIIERFTALNPYDPAFVPGSILELEPENLDPVTGKRRRLFCYAISAKRYCLYTLSEQGEPRLVKWSEHALGGFYLNPTDPEIDDRDWVRQAWEWILRQALGLDTTEPAWLDTPAISRFTATHPRLLRPFKHWNRTKPYARQVKPGNFLLIAHITPGGHPAGTDPEHFILVAPYEPDPTKWQRLPWTNLHAPEGPTYRITDQSLIDRGGHALPAGVVGVRTFRDVLDRYRTHPEPKSLAPDGRPCTRATTGLLDPRPIRALSITHVGKETNLLDEIQAGLIGDEDEVLTEYRHLDRDTWLAVELPALRLVSMTRLVTASGLPERTIQYARAGRRPRPQQHNTLITACAAIARGELVARGAAAPPDDLDCLRHFVRARESVRSSPEAPPHPP